MGCGGGGGEGGGGVGEKKGGTGYCRNIIATRIRGHCHCKLKFALTTGLI